MNNLYIALSTHHLSYCEKIASENSADTNILITGANFEINKALFNRIVFLEKTAYNQSSSILSKITNAFNKTATYKKVIHDIKDLKAKSDLTLYYSSLEDILSNYLLFSFAPNMRGVVIEDGVLNYYNHTFKNVSKLNFRIKKIIALIYGMKIMAYNGHTSGIDYEQVEYQLVREPEHAIRPDKSKILPLEKRHFVILNEDILIVGQEPYAAILNKKTYKDKLLKLSKLIKLDTNFNISKTIYYKPHRHGPRMELDFLKDLFKKNNFIYIEDNLSMEDLYFSKIKCKYIYTFDSSAVFSIYSDAPYEMRESLNITVMPFYSFALNRLFNKLNFRIIKDDI